ncbi:MAG TPA: RluA family pseudouridine synthase [Vicinamibacterales bacterium]|nr:RluA family pseudouridine synthase [Vicinamibacterales bacterium]
MTRWIVTESEQGLRLDAWLARRSEVGARAKATAWIERGKVFLNGTAAGFPDAGRRLQAGDEISLWVDRPGTATPVARRVAAARPLLHVVHEDRAILIADKPPGLLVEPLPDSDDQEPTLLDLVADHLRTSVRSRPLVVHRIDRDTSGLVLFAKTTAAQQALKAQFERREPTRIYLALVRGVVSPASGTWRDKLVWDKARLMQRLAHPRDARSKDAVAHYRVLEQFRDEALLEVSLVTGKRNQIRVQAGRRGHPIVGERLYRFGAARADGSAIDRQALHAARLEFAHPVTGKPVRASAPLPDDMRALVERLRQGRPA